MKRVFLIGIVCLAFASSLLGAEKDVYIVGLDAAFPPFTWVEAGQFRGFDVEVIRAIAELEGFRVEFRDLPWA
ncbi:MAG TPA: transporter substrate-binding domain-containing protein, partial [Candidatus Acetothermia bacterium]|nr:transporter substrate-binding domain-containing protein [Candidatus Acetothermia bacterium]